ncbi:unnamed protein product, partial [Ectocarpus sp. 13 AM-2016]
SAALGSAARHYFCVARATSTVVRTGEVNYILFDEHYGVMVRFLVALLGVVAVVAAVFPEGHAAAAAADEEERGSNDQVKIGELYQGRVEPKEWIPITRSSTAPQPYPPETDSWSYTDTTLWTGIASFRDPQCGETLFNLFSKASYPERLTAGVVQQNLEDDEGCLTTYCRLMAEKDGKKDCPFRDNIRVLEMRASEAQGPCWARHLQSYLLADEEFCMQVDSHMDFVEGWDMAMMEEWAATNNEYGVLSTYVQDSRVLGVNVSKKWEVAHLCEVFFSPSQQPRNQQARAIHEMTEPKLTTTWGAGYSFSKCHAERRVPYDPNLDRIFDGEEFSKMARLWTNGYDVYTPRRGHLVHDYSHPHHAQTTSWRSNKKVEGDGGKDRQRLANQRLWNLMEMPQSREEGRREVQGDPWGLGDRRTLDEFIEFTGVDLRNKEHIGVTGDRCGSGVEWVPYSLDDDSGDGEETFVSWRRRKGLDPVTAGPRWSEMKGKLEASGVDVWWDPRPGERKAAPKARGADGGRQENARPERYDEGGGDVAAQQARQPPGGQQGGPVAA